MASERLVSDSKPMTRTTCHYSSIWNHSEFPSWTEPAGHTRLSNEAMARWESIRKLWSDEASALGANAAAATPKSVREPSSNKEAGLATMSNRNHHHTARVRYDDTPQRPSGVQMPLPPLCGGEQQSSLLETRSLDDASGLGELSRTNTTTSYSTSAGPSSPSSSSGSDGGAECCTGLATGHVTSPPRASARDDYNYNYNYHRHYCYDDDGDGGGDDDDGRRLTRHLLTMAAADLRAKRASRRSVGGGGGSNAGGQTTYPAARKAFQFRCDAPVFTPMVGSLGTF
ncbi:hypothetical protein MAPG_04656 [Magnaporthiopsis poae ATCC 64411]|uniref:Uncharacterized protein n=1 Tax=Magnaporthiopsis poae (strain ATCC 64411 / 73-15) TaxID=644358 RepID=A0A0C4DXB5_MAGP6|nr:hypothetical protein MAPG_04656 [Magnaporthiopsis poae ATCC 64411]